MLDKFQHLQAVQFAFNGIRVAVLGLVLKAFYTMYKKCPKNLGSYVIAALAFIGVGILDIDTIYVLIICALFGVGMSLIAKKKFKKI